MDHDFWHERWDRGTTAWHRDRPDPALVERWDRVGVAPGATTFVPLCGKSVDMAWLADRGHRIVGSELSEIAVRGFFEDVSMVPTTTPSGPLTRFAAGPYDLWCGDLFDLPDAALAGVDVVYDRAALVALPSATRQRYAEFMATRLPPGTPVFLLTYVYDDREMGGPPFSVGADEIDALFGDRFDVDLVADDQVLGRNPDLEARGLNGLRELTTILRRTDRTFARG